MYTTHVYYYGGLAQEKVQNLTTTNITILLIIISTSDCDIVVPWSTVSVSPRFNYRLLSSPAFVTEYRVAGYIGVRS